MVDFDRYDPKSRILFLSICSLHKKKGGTKKFDIRKSVISRLSPQIGKSLREKREEVRNLIWSGKITWGGIGTEELDFNNNLAPGPDFGGDADWAEYLPAINRYSGRFFLALGEEGKQKLISSNHHFLFLSGLYGMVTPTEPIQLYSCPLEGESIIQNAWNSNRFISNILIDYIKRNDITKIFDFTARNDYRNLIDWDYIQEETGVNILFCFTRMSAFDYSLIEFGNLLRETLLDFQDDELIGIQPDETIGDVVFRGIPETLETLPKEDEIRIIQNAAKEFPHLPEYSLFEIERKFGEDKIVVECLINRDLDDTLVLEKRDELREIQPLWSFSFTSEFQRNINKYNDKKFQGRILEAISSIASSPMTRRGDTVKPLKEQLIGKWRYRIGNYRLIYEPDPESLRIYLIAILPRGNAYD